MPLQPPLTQVQAPSSQNDACSDENDFEVRRQTQELVFVNGTADCCRKVPSVRRYDARGKDPDADASVFRSRSERSGTFNTRNKPTTTLRTQSVTSQIPYSAEPNIDRASQKRKDRLVDAVSLQCEGCSHSNSNTTFRNLKLQAASTEDAETWGL